MWRTAADKLENFLAERFKQNAHLGRVALTDVLSTMWEAKQQQVAMT